jgi:hypothetical protein
LTKANQSIWIAKAVELPKAELEKQIAKEHPETLRREFIRSVSEDRFLFRLDISDKILRKIRRAQTLGCNKKRDNMDLEQTLEMVVDHFLERNDPVLKAERAAAAKEIMK